MGLAVQGLARFVYTLAIGRIAGPESLGDTVTLLSVAVYIALVFPAGLAVAASRFLPIDQLGGAAIRQLTSWFWLSSGILALAAIPLAYWLVGDFASALSTALLVLSYNAYVFYRGALMGESRVLRVAVADFISSLVAITALVGVLWGRLEWAVLLPLAAAYTVFAILARPVTRPTPVAYSERKELARFVVAATIASLATGGLLPATIIFVRAFDTPTQAGLFAAALSLATPASLLSQALNQVLIPHFAKLQHTPAVARRSNVKLTFTTAAVFGVMFAALIWSSPLVLSVLYGDLYAGGSATMRVLLLVVFFISATSSPSAYLMSSGRQNTFALIWAIAFFLGIAIMFAFAPLFGIWGALGGFVVGGIGGSAAIIVTSFALPGVMKLR